MSDDWQPDHRELRPRAPERRAARPIPWPMIGGIILLAILTVVLALLVLGGGAEPIASAEPSPSAGATNEASSAPSVGASAAPSASEAAIASPSAGPSVTPIDLALDTIVITTIDGLSVRAAPGTGAERLGSLANGTPAFVAAGPTDADGYRWYLVSALGLPPNTGCSGPFETNPFNCPAWFGWVASGSPDGTAWLATQPQECAEAPVAFDEIVIGVTDLMRLACFGSDPFTFRAWWPEAPDDAEPGGCVAQDAPSGWLLCHLSSVDIVMIDDSQDFGGIGLPVLINPASGVSMPTRGTWLELTVHLDDPAAQACGDDAMGAMTEERTPEEWVLVCRSQMVVESVTAVDGP